MSARRSRAQGLRRIAELYAVEADIHGSPPERRLAERRARSAPPIETFGQWLRDASLPRSIPCPLSSFPWPPLKNSASSPPCAATGRLGAGECSLIAVSLQRGYTLVIDDRVANRLARRLAPALHIITTHDFVVSTIRHDLPDVDEADRIKHQGSDRHRFGVKLDNFADLLV